MLENPSLILLGHFQNRAGKSSLVGANEAHMACARAASHLNDNTYRKVNQHDYINANCFMS